MVKVTIRKVQGDTYAINVKGHANYGEFGKDVVCSGISILTMASVRTLKKLEIGNFDGGVVAESVEKMINLSIKYSTPNTKAIFTLLEDGLKLIADEHPENIEVREM